MLEHVTVRENGAKPAPGRADGRVAKRLKVSLGTVKRDMQVIQDRGFVEHIGPSNGGYWMRHKYKV